MRSGWARPHDISSVFRYRYLHLQCGIQLQVEEVQGSVGGDGQFQSAVSSPPPVAGAWIQRASTGLEHRAEYTFRRSVLQHRRMGGWVLYRLPCAKG
jgi:hypothetical protein